MTTDLGLLTSSGTYEFNFSTSGDYRLSLHATRDLNANIKITADDNISAHLRVFVVIENSVHLDLELLAYILESKNAHVKFDVFILNDGGSFSVRPFLKLHESSSSADHGVAIVDLSGDTMNYLYNLLAFGKDDVKDLIKRSFLKI